MSIYEVPKNLLAVGYEDPTHFTIMIIIIVFALISGPGANKNMHIYYGDDIFDFDRLIMSFNNIFFSFLKLLL